MSCVNNNPLIGGDITDSNITNSDFTGGTVTNSQIVNPSISGQVTLDDAAITSIMMQLCEHIRDCISPTASALPNPLSEGEVLPINSIIGNRDAIMGRPDAWWEVNENFFIPMIQRRP